MNPLYQELSVNIVKMLVAIVVLGVCGIVIETILQRKVKNTKKLAKYRVRYRYVLAFMLVFMMAKVWVDGFSYLFAVLGIISAALTITQKENIMNVIGFLIIQWRDLFTEDDYIEIGSYCGYVKAIGILNFSLEEASKIIKHEKTGRIIKIPNGLISTQPVINVSTESGFTESTLNFIFTFETEYNDIVLLFDEVYSLIIDFYREYYSYWTQKQRDRYYKQTDIIYRVRQTKPSGVECTVRFISLKSQQSEIERLIFEAVMKNCMANKNLILSKEM